MTISENESTKRFRGLCLLVISFLAAAYAPQVGQAKVTCLPDAPNELSFPAAGT